MLSGEGFDMDKSTQSILDTIFKSASRESEVAATGVRDALRTLIQRIEKPRKDIAKLKSRIDALESEVAGLKSKLPRD